MGKRLHELIKPKTKKAPRYVGETPIEGQDARRATQWAERPFIAMPGKDPAIHQRVAGALRRRLNGEKAHPGDSSILSTITSLLVRSEP